MTLIVSDVSRKEITWLRKHAPGFLQKLLDKQPNGQQAYRFWRRCGGYDRNLRSTRDIHEKIQYVHEKPVRCGLVEQPAQWRWSSAHAWESGEDTPIPIDRDSVPRLTMMDDDVRSKLLE